MITIFKFQIAETVEQVINNILNPAKFSNGEPYWDGYEYEGEYHIKDTDFNCEACAFFENGSFVINTCWSKYSYILTPNKKGGCDVEFDGPMGALFTQNLLPKMTYVPNTLKAKMEDTCWLSISDYFAFRINNDMGLPTGAGAWLNGSFNNEIPVIGTWNEPVDAELLDLYVINRAA